MSMRNLSKWTLLAAVLVATVAQAASSGSSWVFMSTSEAERAAAQVGGDGTLARAWVWTNDYVYTPGSNLTAWWTVVPNGDLYPTTIVAYLQNNQTGVKRYFPNRTDTPTDIFGQPAGSFTITRTPSVQKEVLLGASGRFPALTVPNELGMHTLVVEFRDYTGNTPLKRLYAKISVVDETVTVPASIETDTTWVRTKTYLLTSTTFVRGATLTIEDGTIIKGSTGSFPAASLIVRNDSQLIAEGTRSRPIIFTSQLGPGSRQGGDWGGVALLGKGPINVTPDFLEGLPQTDDTRIGADPPVMDHSCGSVSYVRVEFAGAQLDPNNELNGLTFGACGTGTKAHHLQTHYGFDDGFEWFGGNNDAMYLLNTAGSDDGFDIQKGYTGRVQYYAVVFYHDAFGDHGIEADNFEDNNSATPFTNSWLYNATFVGNGICDDGCDGARLRRGLKGRYGNMIITGFFDNTLDIDDQVTLDNLTSGELSLSGLVVWNNERETENPNTFEGQITDGNALNYLNGGLGDPPVNVIVADPKFRSLERSDWDLRPGSGSILGGAMWELPASDGFFDQSARCAGAFCGEDDWTEEWATKLQESDLVIP